MEFHDNDRLKRIEDTLSRLDRAMLGDKEYGQKGFVARVDDHAKRLKRLEYWAAGLFFSGSTLAIIYNVAVDWVAKK